MGWVVYRRESGHIERWYQHQSSAKRAVTRRKRDLETHSQFVVGPHIDYCSYADYEGVLMGLRGSELKMWQFCRKRSTA